MKWVDFQAGPPLLEALNAGAIDYGYTGDAPPIFAQAAKAKLLYVAAIPARGDGQAILVPANSSIKTLADLKGKKVGFAKGSSGHNLLIAALESAHVGYDEITPIYLPPPTHRRPFPAAPLTPGRSGTRSTPSRKSARPPGRCRSTSGSRRRTAFSSPIATSRRDIRTSSRPLAPRSRSRPNGPRRTVTRPRACSARRAASIMRPRNARWIAPNSPSVR